MADDEKGKDGIRAAIVGELGTMVARLMQWFFFPLIVIVLAWVGHTLNDGHDAITRMEEELMLRFAAIDREMADHESRLREVERSR